MKVVQINTIFPYGSTGKIIQCLHTHYLDRKIESIVLFGHGHSVDPSQRKICSEPYMKYQALVSRVTGLMYGGCYFSTNKIISILKKEKPDIVHLHCINGHIVNIPGLIDWLKKNKIKTVLTNHAEIMYTANCQHALACEKYQTGCGKCPRLKLETHSWFFDGTHRSWVKMKRAFDGFETLIITNVSPWLTERASRSLILREFPHRTVLNGIDTDIFHYKDNHADHGKKIVLHVTANFSDSDSDIKGGKYVIDLARRFEGCNVIFIVAGKHQSDLRVPSNMILLGEIKSQDRLSELYSQADLTVLTSKKETFSMVVAESLCCGTPVIGFKAGAPEAITIPQYSKFVEHGNTDALYEGVAEFLDKSFDKAEISAVAKLKYCHEKMADDYLKVYEELLSE